MRFSFVVLALPLAFSFPGTCETSAEPSVAETSVQAGTLKEKAFIKDAADTVEGSFKPANVGASKSGAAKNQGIPRDAHLHEKVAPDLSAYDLWKYELCL